jgi:phage gp29-like protein
MGLLDYFKKKKDPPPQPKGGEVITDQKLESFTASFIGTALTNPDPILLHNRDNKGIELYHDMAVKDPKISSLLQTRKYGVAGKPWHIEPGSEEDKDAEIAQIIQFNILEKIDSFYQDLVGAISCIQYGYSVMEVIWGYDEKDSLIRPFFLKSRDPQYFLFEKDTHLPLFKPPGNLEGQKLPDYKFIIFRHDPEYENPYGKSLMRDLYWYWWMKKFGVKWWAMAVERYGSPSKIMKYPSGIDDNIRSSLQTQLEKGDNFGANYVIPKDIELTLLEGMKKAGGDQERFATYIDNLSAQRILGQTLTSDIGNVGSKAAEQGHEQIRQDIIEADAKVLQHGFNELIRWIHWFNWGEPKYSYPTIKIEYEPEEDRKLQAEIVDYAVKWNIALVKEEVYAKLGLRMPTDDDEILEVSPPMNPIGSQEPDDDDDNSQKQFAEADKKAEVELNRAAIYPPSDKKVYRVSSFAHITNRFQRKIETFMSEIADGLPEIFQKAGVERDMFESLLADWLRDNYETPLRGHVTKATKDAMKFAAYDMAERLEYKLSRPVFDAMTRQFLTDHFYEFGNVERITQMRQTMTRDLLKAMDRFTEPDKTVDDLIDAMTDHWKGFVAPMKTKQIVLSEVNGAASWGANNLVKQTGMEFDAWFWVDPASCKLCQEWAMDNPYSVVEAGQMGLRHPSCNDQWVYTLKEAK